MGKVADIGERQKTTPTALCASCGENLGKSGWRPDARITHCEGGVAGWRYMSRPHHTREPLHDPCWRCGRNLGCPRCTDPEPMAVWCGQCAVWQSAEALLLNGVHRGITLENHPADWVERFRTNRQAGPAPEAEFNATLARLGMRVEREPVRAARMPRVPGEEG